MYKCEHFAIHELVPPHVFEQRGEKAWELLDDRLLVTLDRLRERYGSMTVNNYYWGSDREWSGLRTNDSPYYSPYSQHTFGPDRTYAPDGGGRIQNRSPGALSSRQRWLLLRLWLVR